MAPLIDSTNLTQIHEQVTRWWISLIASEWETSPHSTSDNPNPSALAPTPESLVQATSDLKTALKFAAFDWSARLLAQRIFERLRGIPFLSHSRADQTFPVHFRSDDRSSSEAGPGQTLDGNLHPHKKRRFWCRWSPTDCSGTTTRGGH